MSMPPCRLAAHVVLAGRSIEGHFPALPKGPCSCMHRRRRPTAPPRSLAPLPFAPRSS